MSQLSTPKSVLVSLGFLVAVGLAPATVPSAHAFGIGTKADVEGMKAIRGLYASFVVEWNKHDVPKMAAHWAIDGDHVEPDGTVVKGADEVAALLTKQHASVFKNSKLTLTVKSVWIISDTVALVDGTYQLEGAVLPDGTAIPAREGMLTSVLLLERGKWSIEASRLMIPTKLPYKPKSAGTPADAAAPKQP